MAKQSRQHDVNTGLKFIGALLVIAIAGGPILGPWAMTTRQHADVGTPDQFGAITLDCGSVFSPLDAPVVTDAASWNGGSVSLTSSLLADFKSACDDKLTEWRIVGIGLTVGGVVVWCALIVVCVKTRKNPIELFNHVRAQTQQTA